MPLPARDFYTRSAVSSCGAPNPATSNQGVLETQGFRRPSIANPTSRHTARRK